MDRLRGEICRTWGIKDSNWIQTARIRGKSEGTLEYVKWEKERNEGIQRKSRKIQNGNKDNLREVWRRVVIKGITTRRGEISNFLNGAEYVGWDSLS